MSKEAISSDDPNAVERLHEKLVELEAARARWKVINKALAKKGGDDAVKAALAAIEPKLSPRELQDVAYGAFGGRFRPLSFRVSNLGAEIRRCEERIAAIEAQAARGEVADVQIGDVLIREADNRVQLIFPGKPSEAVRSELKANGFRWAPSVGAWQLHASAQARYKAERIASGLVSP